MSLTDQVLTIAIAAGATMLTRFLPFLIFRNSNAIPPFVNKLGDFLPPAILGMLVVYCYRSVIFSFNTSTVTALLAGGMTLITYLWRKNTLLSIAGGTISYILLAQLI